MLFIIGRRNKIIILFQFLLIFFYRFVVLVIKITIVTVLNAKKNILNHSKFKIVTILKKIFLKIIIRRL
jgi:hypothetical protein